MMSSVRVISVGPKMTANGLGPPAVCGFCAQLSGSRT